MRERLLLLLSTVLIACNAAAADDALPEAPGPASAALLGNVDFAVDTDGVHVADVRLGGVHACGAYLDDLGFSARRDSERAAEPSRDTTSFARALALRQVADRGIIANAGFLQVAGRTRVVGNASWTPRPVAGTTLSLIAAGDLVGAPAAIDRGIAYGFVGGSAERALVEGVSASGLLGVQSFSDGNERVHVRAHVTWHAVPDYGIDAHVRWRQYESRDDAIEIVYFNPERYAQWTGAVDVHRKLGDWTVSGSLGAGVETVDGAERHPVRKLEFRAEGPAVENLHVTLYARYNRAADDNDFPDTSSSQAGVTLRYPL